MQLKSDAPDKGLFMKIFKLFVIVIASLFCAIQSAILMGDKLWAAFAVSLLPFFAIYLPKVSNPWLTTKVRVSLFVGLTLLTALAYALSIG
jgi:hypothetical protein